MSSRILLIEDEPGLVLTVSDLLSAQGYEVDTAADGDTGLNKAVAGKFDLVILDIMLPKRSGFEVCQELRKGGIESAILMLTARTEVVDRVAGLKLGADDYVTKPFDPAELLARVEALLRRTQKDDHAAVKSFEFGEFAVDFERARLEKAGEPVSVAGKELQLLQYLIQHRGRAVPRDEILQNVWEYSGDVSSRTVDVHIAWLRQKLEIDPAQPRFIHTIRGKGYRFSP